MALHTEVNSHMGLFGTSTTISAHTKSIVMMLDHRILMKGEAPHHTPANMKQSRSNHEAIMKQTVSFG